MPDKAVRLPKFWLARAEKARLSAIQANDQDSKRMLTELADIYEQLAEQAERSVRAAEDAMRRARERHLRTKTTRNDRVRPQ